MFPGFISLLKKNNIKCIKLFYFSFLDKYLFTDERYFFCAYNSTQKKFASLFLEKFVQYTFFWYKDNRKVLLLLSVLRQYINICHRYNTYKVS